MTNEPVWRGAVALRWEMKNRPEPYVVLSVGLVELGYVGKKPNGPWWWAHPRDGWGLGDFATEAEAKAALLDAAVKGLCGAVPPKDEDRRNRLAQILCDFYSSKEESHTEFDRIVADRIIELMAKDFVRE